MDAFKGFFNRNGFGGLNAHHQPDNDYQALASDTFNSPVIDTSKPRSGSGSGSEDNNGGNVNPDGRSHSGIVNSRDAEPNPATSKKVFLPPSLAAPTITKTTSTTAADPNLHPSTRSTSRSFSYVGNKSLKSEAQSTTTTAQPHASHGSSGISGGALAAAIVVPIVVIFFLITLGLFFCRRKRRRSRRYDGSSSRALEVREEPKSNFAGGAPMNFPDASAMQEHSHQSGAQRGLSTNVQQQQHQQQPPSESFLPSPVRQSAPVAGFSPFSKEQGGHHVDEHEDDEVSSIDENEDYDIPEDEDATVGVAQRASVVPGGNAGLPHDLQNHHSS